MQALRHEIEGLRAKRRHGFAPPPPKQRESSVAV
jgi:hypothetical protein